MPERLQLARPVVGTAAGFHADQAGREVGKEQGELRTLELFLQYHLAVLVDTVHLEYVLSQINTNRSNLHVDTLICCK